MSRQTITLRCIYHAGSEVDRPVEAVVAAGLAVHPAQDVVTTDGQPSFAITHVASGRRASPLYFETEAAARSVVSVLELLPVDWMQPKIGDDETRPHIASVIRSASALFGGYLVDRPMDQTPAGSA